mgnify:CR=1 FL=1
MKSLITAATVLLLAMAGTVLRTQATSTPTRAGGHHDGSAAAGWPIGPPVSEAGSAAKAAASGSFDAVVCLGVLVRGGTAHFDLIAAEDTRHTGRLLSHFGVKTRLLALHDYNEAERAGLLVDALREGRSVALVSDAGTPLVSDPGYRLVRAAHEQAIRVVPLPGASAVTARSSSPRRRAGGPLRSFPSRCRTSPVWRYLRLTGLLALVSGNLEFPPALLCRIAWQHCSRRRPFGGASTICAPAATGQFIDTDMPKLWKYGRQASSTSLPRSARRSAAT